MLSSSGSSSSSISGRLSRSSSSSSGSSSVSSSMASSMSLSMRVNARRLSISSLLSVSSSTSSCRLPSVAEEGREGIAALPSSPSPLPSNTASSRPRAKKHRRHPSSISARLLSIFENMAAAPTPPGSPPLAPASAAAPGPLRSSMRSPISSPSDTALRPSTATSIASSSATNTGFIPRVSFDATQPASAGSHGGGTGIEQSFTLRATTAGFARTRESRTFLVATDLNEYSLHAMHWSLDRLIEDGDELVVLRVLDPSSSTPAIHATISDQAREEANMLIRSVIERNSYIPPAKGADTPSAVPLREIGITVEFVIGKVQESIQKMISVYRPDSLIVGTRGRSDSLLKSAFIGSVSKYCVANSPVPVIVVRPAIKVHKMLAKRESRQAYGNLVEASTSTGAELTKSATRLNLYKASTVPVQRTEDADAALPRTSTSNDAILRGAPLTQTKTMS